jgi:hypothetical protein
MAFRYPPPGALEDEVTLAEVGHQGSFLGNGEHPLSYCASALGDSRCRPRCKQGRGVIGGGVVQQQFPLLRGAVHGGSEMVNSSARSVMV